MATTSKPRLRYFDMLKGVAIFIVVMGHIITMCVREVDRAFLFKFVEQLHMPLFFFISGWFAYRVTDGRLTVPKLGTRLLRLLLPMVVVSSLWVIYFPHSGLQSPLDSTFSGLWNDTYKNGYWFTMVLFEIFVLYAATVPLLRVLRSTLAQTVAVVAECALLWWLYFSVIPAHVSAWLSLGLLVSFYPAFMFGVLARSRRDDFMARVVHSSGWQTAAMLIFATTMYVVCWPWEFALDGWCLTAVSTILHLCLAVIALAVFERWADAAFAPESSSVSRRIASVWEYLGKQSLGIYLLHYFFLFPMGDVFRSALLGVNVSFVPMLVFSAFWTVCVIAVVLGVMYVLSFSRPLNLIITGTK